MTLRLWLIAAVLASIAASGLRGYQMGVRAADARHAAALSDARDRAMRAAETASRAEAGRLAAQADADALALQLEEAANADPDRDRPALGADSVRRIDRR